MSPPRRRLLGTSLKTYFDLPRTAAYTESILPLAPLAAAANIDLFLIPSFLSIPSCAALLAPTGIQLGAQTVSAHAPGAHTGDVTAEQLRQAGVHLVEIGHAERRREGETDAMVAAQARQVVEQGMVPLVCVGEVTAPPSSGPVSAAVGKAVDECGVQVRAVLDAVSGDAELIFAYEPVWAIGAAQPAGADHVVAVTREIRRMAEGRKGLVRILYGGSAGPGTFEAMKDGVDGLFLGRFAHDIKNLEQVIKEMSG